MDVLGHWPLSELVPHIEWAARREKPVVFVGTGTERLHRDDSRRLMREVLAPRVRAWSVRSRADEERLTSYGIPADRVTVAADLAWLLDPVSSELGRACLEELGIDGDERLLGVNLTNERFVTDADPELPAKLAVFLDAVIEKYDVRVLFLANEVREGESFEVEDLGRDLGWAYTCPLIGVQASELTDMLGEIVESPEAVRSKLETESARMRERAKTNDVALERLLAG